MADVLALSRLLIELGAVVTIVAVAAVARRWPYVFFAAIAVFTFQPNWQTTAVASVHGTSVHGLDLLVVVGGMAAFLGRTHLRKNLGVGTLSAGALTVVLLASLIRGLHLYGQSAVNQARPFLAVGTVIAFVLSLEDLDSWSKKLLDGFVVTAVGLTPLALFHAATRGVGSSSSMIYDSSSGQWVTGRILIAAQAMVVAIAAMICMYRWAARQGKHNLALWLWLTAIVIACQHRSVWLAMLLGLVVLLIRTKNAIIVRSSTTLLIAGLLLVPLATLGPARTLVHNVAMSLSSVSDQRSTLVDRQQSWTTLVDQSRSQGAATVALGEPFGQPWTRNVLDRVESYSPHNWYVTIFLRSGLAGLLAAALLLLHMFSRSSNLDRALRLALATALLTYLLPYSLDVQEAPALGLLLYSGREARPFVRRASRKTTRALLKPGIEPQRELVHTG